MTMWQEFVQAELDGGATPVADAARPCVGCYGDLDAEYRVLADGPALVDRSCRGLFQVNGADRATWLHNLTTNDVKNLSAGEGHYAFVLNVKGRILFDANICIRKDSIWIDLDRRVSDVARSHFEKYIITEDVSITDHSDKFIRLGLAGDAAKTVLAELGVGHAATMPWLGTAEMTWGDCSIPLIRHDFCGPFAVELLVPVEMAVAVWGTLCDPSRHGRAVPVGDDAVQIRRIEAGLPWPFHEITNEYLPAETKQFERAVSFTKGCYLGQEVVERMRSRDVVARQLVGMEFDGDAVPPNGTELTGDQDKRVGQITSACRSLGRGGVIALGYVKTVCAAVGTPLRAKWEDQSVAGVVAGLPFTPARPH